MPNALLQYYPPSGPYILSFSNHHFKNQPKNAIFTLVARCQ